MNNKNINKEIIEDLKFIKEQPIIIQKSSLAESIDIAIEELKRTESLRWALVGMTEENDELLEENYRLKTKLEKIYQTVNQINDFIKE